MSQNRLKSWGFDNYRVKIPGHYNATANIPAKGQFRCGSDAFRSCNGFGAVMWSRHPELPKPCVPLSSGPGGSSSTTSNVIAGTGLISSWAMR